MVRPVRHGEKVIRRGKVRDPGPSQFLDQAILMRPVAALDAPFGLRRVRRNDANRQLPRTCGQIASAARPRSPALPQSAYPHIHVLPIGVERARKAIGLKPPPQHGHRRPDRFLSAEPAERRPVASSTNVCRQLCGPRSSNQGWKLPSSCTNSPKCALRSRRRRCGLRFRARLHSPASNIHRRSVS